MNTYFMFGKYSAQARKGISASRTKEAEQIINKLGGKVESMYVLLGEYDLILIVSFPNVSDVIKASLSLTNLSGITFSSLPAISVADFDKIAAQA
jgi:uncharacterized protein with GYD domain